MMDVHQPGRRAKLCPVDFLPAAHAADKLKRKVTSVADCRDKKCHQRWRQYHAINCLYTAYTAYTIYTVFIHCLYCVNCFTPLKKKHVCLYKSLRKVTSTLALQWEAYCTKVIGSTLEGNQKGHKYTCFATRELCIEKLYNLYALVIEVMKMAVSCKRMSILSQL